MSFEPQSLSLSRSLQGRTFVGPAFDYLLIGGGLSLAVTILVVLQARLDPGGSGFPPEALPYLILLTNAAHFAASTVRLYTKPDSRQTWPFLTMAFPLVALIVLTICMFSAGRLGHHLQSLYLTWSPYHYAAQAYGLAVVYSMRSGCKLAGTNKILLWWVAMLPFFYNFLTAPGVGVNWLLPRGFLPPSLISAVHYFLLVAAFLTPLLLFVRVWRTSGVPMPLISLLTVVTNGIWFFVLPPLDAFVYATVFHGIQYMAIVIIFHVKEQRERPDNTHGVGYHVAWFYGASLLLGYALFNCLPLAYMFAGFGRIESVLLVVAAINLHHFIVDAYIWRLRRGDSNRGVVDASVGPSVQPTPA